jgi:uncharacterized membrane protein YkoI
MRFSLRSAAFAALAIVAASGLAWAPVHADDDDVEELRQAVQRKEIRSLSDILAMIRGKLPGDVIGVEIEREDGRWQYEFKVIDSQGRLFDVRVNARTAQIERIKEK